MNHNITGTFEGYSINENKNIMIVVTSEIIKNNQGKFSLQHNFRYYKNLECEYSYIKEKMEDFDLKENVNDESKIDHLNTISAKTSDKDIKLFNSFYEDFSLLGSSNILNIAVSDNLIAYTTLMNRFHLFYSYK